MIHTFYIMAGLRLDLLTGIKMAINKRKGGGNKGDNNGTTSVDPYHKTRLVTPNQEKREAWVRGELASVKPKVTLPKFNWDK